MFQLLWQTLSKESFKYRIIFVPCGAGGGKQCTPNVPAPTNCESQMGQGLEFVEVEAL